MKNIKKYKHICLGILVSTLSLTSCEDSLDTLPTNRTDATVILSDPALVENLLFKTYNSTETWGYNNSIWWSRRYNLESGSYEAKFNFKDQDRLRLRAGWTPTNVGDFRLKWENYWSYIREANDFIEKVESSEAMSQDPSGVAILVAEMRFLRANIYFKLINLWGGVPIIEKAGGLDDSYDLARNSYEECVDFIVSELDQVIAVLPETRPSDEFGRATSLSAMAVKSRLLLYAASNLHDSSTVPNGPLYDYTKASKWEDAADAAKDIIDAVADRDLISVADAKEYQNLFLSVNQDILFGRAFGSTVYGFGVDVNSLPDQTQSPSGYGGWALSSPTHNFALEFNMEDGTDTSTGTYDPLNPNDNREMRYYANILYNGAQFRGRDVQYFLSDDPATNPHGLDSPEGLGNVLHSSKTGYNIRKFQNESVGLTETTPGRPYILYRLAEVYLNYAEASYHLSDEINARKYVNKVASRALLPEITVSGVDLLEAIKRERRIELCFEGHNFYDERRWMNTANLGFDIKGLKWKKDVLGNVTNEEYTVINRPWFERHYYLPIPQEEINKLPLFKQNTGYGL
ncbi:RagB/SusD family nutrient uptake outer membrane protein [Wenyingzhuangia sp. 2_MG-2023]|uniref:RagB/SusD family nutrient uptake outer membrane protein n=1 Tax=Wenyingzhuangia sp. 2_MG-2023 TaxID=3062639 RepID=UPI0026E40E0B|nr:RagB/SusD family nutrient uptake outer membrane protein [Wenyingzhuangia sp. 2_MG-2023]MDO6737004.1 RagB/SusD family nutrient uptake outer membrane protein [Wenyingzhuangia sp. 2_MG-2023]